MLSYNSECTIDFALQGIHDHVDRIVVVDGLVGTNGNALAGGSLDLPMFSTDGTEHICRKYPRVKFIRHANARGHKANKALESATPDCNFIWIIDSDEIYNPDDIPKLKDYLLFDGERHGGFSVPYVTSYGDCLHFLDCSGLSFDKKCELCYANRIWKYERGFGFKSNSQEALYDRNGFLHKSAVVGEPGINVGRRGTCIIPEDVILMMHIHNLRMTGTMKNRISGKKMVDGVEYVRYSNGGKIDWIPVASFPENRIPSFMKGCFS